ncbi:MAG: hypothetical protein ACI85Q_001807 [Salibacteraceae bacterium]|jgi:hypothetical protein
MRHKTGKLNMYHFWRDFSLQFHYFFKGTGLPIVGMIIYLKSSRVI